MYTEQQAIERLQQVASELGRTPTASYWNRQHILPSTTVIKSLFGSWNKALEAAGLHKNAILNYTKESLAAKLQAVAQELGRTPTKDYWDERHLKPTAPIYQKIFGSWNKALKIAGLEPNKRTPTREEVKQDLLHVAEALGHIPSSTEYLDYGTFCIPTVYAHLGHWQEALERAGLVPPANGYNYFGNKVRCKDGHIADSMTEALVDDFLYEEQIIHATHVRVTEDQYWTCDFVVKDLWIEIDGLGDSRPLSSSHAEKIQYYRDNHFSHIVVSPHKDPDWKLTISNAIANLSR